MVSQWVSTGYYDWVSTIFTTTTGFTSGLPLGTTSAFQLLCHLVSNWYYDVLDWVLLILTGKLGVLLLQRLPSSTTDCYHFVFLRSHFATTDKAIAPFPDYCYFWVLLTSSGLLVTTTCSTRSTPVGPTPLLALLAPEAGENVGPRVWQHVSLSCLCSLRDTLLLMPLLGWIATCRAMGGRQGGYGGKVIGVCSAVAPNKQNKRKKVENA